MKSGLYICVDFDGTVVEHDYPRLGAPIPGAIETIKELESAGHKIILFTMRSGKTLDEAVDYLRRAGVNLFGINTNPTQKRWTSSPKAYGNIFIDDAALGCPTTEKNGRLRVEWAQVRELLRQRAVLP